MATNDDEMECLTERKVPDRTSVGIIEEITLKNFMCHSELQINNLSKNKITFITGPNGSGKSAILTSLMLGFGGRANITCRGHTTKGFVKEGKPHAEILLKIRNDTSFGSYQFGKFGKFITIKRRLNQSGTSEYFLLDERNQPVYKTASALKKLTSFFDIHVENPLMLLTQENAKKLLFDASEKEMYKFFRAGTGLDEIQTRMENLRGEIQRVRHNWNIRRDVYESRKKETEALKKRYNRYREVENFQQRELELTQSLEWVDLAQQERELTSIRSEADRLANQRAVVEKRKDDMHHCIEDLNNRVTENAQAVQALAEEIEHAKGEVQAAQQRRSEAVGDTKKVEAEVQFRQKKLVTLNNQKQDVIRAIEAAQRKLRAKQGADAEKQRGEAKLVELRHQKEELEASLTQETAGREEAQHRLAECRQAAERLREQEFALRRDAEQLAKQRASYENVQSNTISRFGRQMPAILREIENAVRQGVFRRPPLGPLGRYISLVGDESWAPAVEGAIGKHYSSFIVSCQADRKALHDILQKKVGLRPSNTQEYPQIIMSERSLGQGRVDISRNRANCPNSNLLSFFDLAEVTDDDVFNFLLELSTIELKLFAEDAHASLDLVNNGRCNNTIEVIGKNMDRIRYFTNTRSSNFESNRYPIRTNYLMKNVEQQMADVRQREQEVNVRYQEVRHLLESANREVGAADASARRIEATAAQISNRIRGVDSEIERLSRLAATVFEEPNDVVLLEEDLQRKEAEIEAFKASQEQVVLEAKIKAAVDQRKAADRLLEEARANMAQKEQAHERAEEEGSNIHRSAGEARRKLPGIREQFDKLTEQWNAVKQQAEEQELRCKATLESLRERYGTRPRTRTNESRREIEQQLKDLRDKIADRERIDKTGFDSIPERQKSLEHEHQELEQRDLQLQSLEQIVQRRIDGFPKMVSLTARHIELWFSRMSYTKNLNSQLKFDHTQAALSFKVSSMPVVKPSKQRRMTTTGTSQPSLSQISVASTTSNSQTPQAATSRSIKTLSGGERSMSTVFFLLSMWENSEGPVKGMDEFDVFLDGENREQAINLIATYSPSMAGQFFLLSPCNVSSLGNTSARHEVIELKKEGQGSRTIRRQDGSENLSQDSGVPRKRHSRARVSQSQPQAASTSQIAEETVAEDRQEAAAEEEGVPPTRRAKKRRVKMEPTSEEEEDDETA